MENNIVTERNQQSSEFEQYQQYQDLLKIIENNHRKDTKRMYSFFIGLFLLFVTVIWISLIFIDSSFISELRAGNDSVMKNTDYLELIIPILIAIAATFIAFLGMNRLKDMDIQVDQMRSSINIELDKEIKRVASLRSDLSEHIDVAISRKTVGFAENMEEKLMDVSNNEVQQVIKSQNDALSEISKSKEAALELFEQIKADWNYFDKRYKWLLSSEQVTKDTFFKEVATVYDVHQAVEAMWNSHDRPDNVADLTQRYVGKVTADDSVLRGDDDDYHNLAAECASHYLYNLACEVCETGLKFFKKNIDLLADWIQYGTKLGDINVVINNPLCANKLAELLSDCGRLEEALVAANRAIQELSQGQPSVNYGYVVYQRALIQDRMSYNKNIDSARAFDLATKAIIDYQVAINSKRLSTVSLKQANIRCNMLKTYFNVNENELQNIRSDDDVSLSEIIEGLKKFATQSDGSHDEI